MPKFTEEQQLAIDLEGSNILVSAGAGSGKTAVLTERVLRKLKEGTHINELLIIKMGIGRGNGRPYRFVFNKNTKEIDLTVL